MKQLETLARRRITSWLDSNIAITQTKLAEAVGVSQSWVSQYKSGDQNASIDQLATMAHAFGHTLAELLDLRSNPIEAELLEAYRRLPPSARAVALQVVQKMAPEIRRHTRSSKTAAPSGR